MVDRCSLDAFTPHSISKRPPVPCPADCVCGGLGSGGRVVNHPLRAESVIGASGTATARRLDALCALKTPAVWLPAHQQSS